MDWVSRLTAFDFIVLVIVLVSTGYGIWRGLIRQIAFIVALVTGFVAAGLYHGAIYGTVLSFIDNTQIAFLLTYFILFVVIYLAVILLGVFLKKVMEITMLDWFDHTMGGLFGLLKGLLLAVLLFMVLASFLSSDNTFLRKSFFYPSLEKGSQTLAQVIRDADLRHRFLPREPAIKDEELPPVTKPQDKGDEPSKLFL